jgi:hypothetical protein
MSSASLACRSARYELPAPGGDPWPSPAIRRSASTTSALSPARACLELTPQARPNVLFEAGMAFGVHADRTVLVELGSMRPFSDIYGRHVVRLNGTDKPLRDIARRLEGIGCAVDDSNDDWASTRFPERD